MSNRKPLMQQVALEETMGFSLINTCFQMSGTSRNFVLILFLNHLFEVSMVNLSFTENSSAKEVDFSRARTAVAASFSWKKVILSKKGCVLV